MIKEAIGKIVRLQNLTEDEAAASMTEIMSGEATEAQIGSFITALRMKGETIDEITGCAKIMRRFATPIRVKSYVDIDREDINEDDETILDTCGTGGDGTSTFNVSTATAFVVAACGLRVAKHGNRSVSSMCGSADVLEALGVNLNVTPEKVEECLSKIDFSNFSFFSMRSLINLAGETGIRAQHIDIQEEHEASLFRAYKIGVVVPAYNEERLIQETIDGIPAYVDKIYVINDASRDRTAEIINNMTDLRVIPIHHKVNKGVGAAITSGYKRALTDEIDLVAVMAGDNQMDPDQLSKLIMPVIEGKADYAKGNRLLSQEMRQGMPRFRAIGNGMLSMLTKIGSGYWNIADPQNGYTVISKHALETIDLDSIYPYYGYCNDMLLKMNAFSFKVVDVTMPARYGSEKSKIRYGKYIRKVAPMIFIGFLWRLKMKYMVLDFHPLVLFYFTSMVLIPFGLLFGLWIFLQKTILHGQVSENYPLLDVFISLAGLQLMFFAMFFDMQVNKTSEWKTG